MSSRGDWRLPADLVTGSGRGRKWAIDNLAIAQFLLTTRIVDTGRTDQFYAENVNVEGQKLIGPWRVEGSTTGIPFRFTTGELSEDKTVQVKVTGGGDTFPRFDIEGRLSLERGQHERHGAGARGQGKAPPFGQLAGQVAAAGIPIPISIDTEFQTSGDREKSSPIQLDAGEGGASLRMTG